MKDNQSMYISGVSMGAGLGCVNTSMVDVENLVSKVK